ncbi:hypothetical protein [uncultured Bacteroides sp.]|uniref:hypothetical protein n=1 Tax=uncultured Bacteroides sp. TaxID=162156 RepID=UPI0026393E5C|nr:hypothetical protein [uncultured Bacteroides sp.]
MNDNIYTFRSNDRTETIIQEEKKNGNLSRFINFAIANTRAKKFDRHDVYLPCIKEDGLPYKKLSMLPLSDYSAAMKILKDSGYSLHTFNIDKETKINIISSSREMAENEFLTYFVPAGQEYLRTERPFTEFSYCRLTKTVKITYYEESREESCND